MDTTCIAIDQEVECVADATMTSPVPLCDRHQLQVALAVVPDMLTTALRHAGSAVKPMPLAPDVRAAVIAGSPPRPVGARMAGVHAPVVYFADTGSRIKIGFSTNLRSRLRSLSLQQKDVALLLDGGLTLERALHDTFAMERIDSTEWFAKSDRLAAFIESKCADLAGRHRQKVQRQARKRLVHLAPADPAEPHQRSERVEIIRRLIRDVGGDPEAVPLKLIQERFGVHKSTASRMRSDASSEDA